MYSLAFILYFVPNLWTNFVHFLNQYAFFIMPLMVVFLDGWFYLSARRHVSRLNRSFSKIVGIRLFIESNIFFSANIMAGIYMYDQINKLLTPLEGGEVFSQYSVLFIVIFLYHGQFVTSRSLQGLNYKNIAENIRKYEKD